MAKLSQKKQLELFSSGRGAQIFERVDSLSEGFQKSGNAIFQGENLKVLEALLPKFEGKVKCCYIDPPYNNKEKHYHYHDSREHREWLESLVARIEIIVEFLSDDGSLWISMDDREVHYLKVACDEIIGRKNFVTTIIWQQRTSRENRKVFSNNHEYVLVYAKNLKRFSETRNSLSLNEEVISRYKNPDNDPRGPWQSVTATAQAGHGTPAQFYKLVGPTGKEHFPPHGRCWIYNLSRMKEEIGKNNIWFGSRGDGVPRVKRFMSQMKAGLTPQTLWPATEVGTNDSAKKHLLKLLPDLRVFDTPKPEELVQRILEIGSSPGDLVLDAYLGSGTTAAVAHKCGRNYIGIEEGEHAASHAAKRLALVVRGEPFGISATANWTGGGGFDFFRLVE